MSFRSPTTVRLSFILMFFWGSMIMIEGFMVPYLTSIGISERQAGLVMAAVFLVSVVSTPLWGLVADRTGRHRRIIVLSLGVAIVVVLMIPLSGTTLSLIIGLGLLYSLTANSMPALIDSWIMKMRRDGAAISYGVARGFGSFGYALSGAILGIVLERFGLVRLFPIYAGVALVVLALVLSTAQNPRLNAPPGTGTGRGAVSPSEAPAPPPPSGVVQAVLGNSRYLFLLAACFFGLLGTRAAITFLPLRIYALGGTTVHVGWAQSIYAGSEIPFMFLSAYLIGRFRSRPVIMVGLIAFVVRLVLTRIAATPATLLAAQATHGLSFGLLLPAAVHYIDRIAPEAYRSLFQTLAPSVFFGMASVVGSAAGGAIIDRFGLDALYTLAPIVSAVGVLIFWVAIVARAGQTAAGRRLR